VPLFQSLSLQNLYETIVLQATIVDVNSHKDMSIEAQFPNRSPLTDICCFRAAMPITTTGKGLCRFCVIAFAVFIPLWQVTQYVTSNASEHSILRDILPQFWKLASIL
jgi:hypothetical protein